MRSYQPDDGDDLLPVVRKQAFPADSAESEDKKRWEGFKRGLWSWWQKWVKGYAWSEAERLKEAKLQDLEAMPEERRAAAQAKLAEARKLDAEAELLYAEAEARRLANERERLVIAEARAGLLKAVRAIEAKGGSVEVEETGHRRQLSPAGDGEAEVVEDES